MQFNLGNNEKCRHMLLVSGVCSGSSGVRICLRQLHVLKKAPGLPGHPAPLSDTVVNGAEQVHNTIKVQHENRNKMSRTKILTKTVSTRNSKICAHNLRLLIML